MVIHKYGAELDNPCFAPIGFLYISSILKRMGHYVNMLNYNTHQYDLIHEIGKADAVLFSGFEEFKPFIIRDAIICREMGKKTILGGALATFLPDEMLQYVDTVVMGEADEVIDLALTFTGKIMGTKPNLDSIPFPDYDAFGVMDYAKYHQQTYIGILSSRGCPFSCGFCSHTCHFQVRSLEDVFAEVDLYREKYDAKLICFNDNTLNVRKDHFLSICAGMKERDFPWTAAIRPDNWSDEMAKIAKESHLKQVVVGIESFRQDKLDRMNKKTTVDQIRSCLDSLHRHDILYHGNILLGFPWETYEDIISEIRDIPFGYHIFPCLVQPFVGTQFRERLITKDQEIELDTMCREYAESSGMECLPGVEA
jgi:radical SAM superfamily enzyme YgiQ (UPF0313 family)